MKARSLTCGTVLGTISRDRVVRNELGRSCFSEALRRCGQGIRADAFHRSEDLQAHYNLMLCYNASATTPGQRTQGAATCASRPTNRRKPSPAHTARPHPENNNERQAIHEHITSR